MQNLQRSEDEKQLLQQDIIDMKKGSLEEMALITFYSLASFWKSLMTFGLQSKITKDNLNVIKEMFSILRKERTLLNYILQNIDDFDLDATSDVVTLLDELNDDTVAYYYRVIEDIEDACETKQEYRGLRPRTFRPTLIDSNNYSNEVIALGENFNSLKEFLGFEEEFWTFIKNHINYVDRTSENTKTASATPILDEKGYVSSINIVIPQVKDLSSALTTIAIYKKAYEIYKMLGTNFNKENIESSSNLEETYQEVYLPKKTKQILNF